MGAQTFRTVGVGKTAREAFTKAVADARFEHGQRYTGTIAEKPGFVMIHGYTGDLADVDAVRAFVDKVEQIDPRLDDKWGPAGCLHLGGERWLFFGWASC